ncbi:hypothetical protein AVDCRST_MAG82-3748 [uncultured Rubrobacteraceae bacterium]|uniref:Uncharacterized protein n=1 Tax=uncultured Rubrobacteraceae bacterium TaxID=349277 RepID=A0A6J4QTR5_9ACTN|nr:hypothetical protein AVDCRST_MAG82-3748 [uncultured Rubrobacteraceae bacterium]
MRRAVILATLTFLLFAVAGVTAAREDTFTSSLQVGDQAESTAPEPTELEPAAPEVTVPEATVPEPIVSGATVPEGLEKPDEGTVEATVVVPEEPKEPGAGNYGGVKDESGIEVADEPAARSGKPEHARGGKKYGMLRETGKPEHPGKPPVRGRAGEKRAGGSLGKVTLCHKGRVTISVGAPAEPAHLRHGDRLGAC